MLDSLNRRSRLKRQPSGKGLIIKQRDLDVLALLYRYRMLSSQDLIAHIQPKSEKRFTERLGQLFHDGGLMDRPKEQWERARATYAHIVYALSAKGKKLLQEHNHLSPQAVLYPEQSDGGIRKQFLHTLKISQTISEAEVKTLNEPYQRFVPLDEIRQRQLSRGKPFKLEFPVTIPISKHNPHTIIRTTVKPDGLYGIEYTETGQKLYRFFAVEVELTSPAKRKGMKLSSTMKKRLAYDAASTSGDFKKALGIPNLICDITRVQSAFF